MAKMRNQREFPTQLGTIGIDGTDITISKMMTLEDHPPLLVHPPIMEIENGPIPTGE
jgi:hypothetical protein